MNEHDENLLDRLMLEEMLKDKTPLGRARRAFQDADEEEACEELWAEDDDVPF